MMFKKIFQVGLIVSSSFGYASVGGDLGDYFNGLGISSNVTSAKAYDNQAAGFVSFGSLYARNQVRNLQLMHVDVPSFRSGCGGIDITAGGFSFIKADQIVQFMQSVLTSGAGYALNLALETELPEIAHSLQYMQKLANDINSSNMNACEMGESLVGGLWSKNRSASQQICEDIGTNTGGFSDWAKARQQCSTGGDMDDKLKEAKENDEYKDRVLVSTNVVWDSLQKNDFLKKDTALSEVYMSVSGTVVFDEKGAAKTYPSLVTNKDFIKALMYGGKLPVYKCKDAGDSTSCLDVSFSEGGYQVIQAKEALVLQVQKVIEGIYKNIVDEKALTPEQTGIINMTQISVFNLISANAQQGIGIQGGFELSQSIAADFIAQYLSGSLEIIRSSLAGKDIGKENEDKIYSDIQKAQVFVDSISFDARERFNQAMKTNELIQNKVKQAVTALNPMLRQSYEGVE